MGNSFRRQQMGSRLPAYYFDNSDGFANKLDGSLHDNLDWQFDNQTKYLTISKYMGSPHKSLNLSVTKFMQDYISVLPKNLKNK